MQARAYDHVRFAVQDWSDQSMHFLRGVGTIPVNHHINISIQPTKHCLDAETFALSRAERMAPRLGGLVQRCGQSNCYRKRERVLRAVQRESPAQLRQRSVLLCDTGSELQFAWTRSCFLGLR